MNDQKAKKTDTDPWTGFRLVPLILLAIFGTSVFFSVYVYRLELDILKGEIKNRNLLLADIISFQIFEVIQSTRKIMQSAANYPEIRELGVPVITPILKTLIQKYKVFNTLYIIDRNGKQLLNITAMPEVFSETASATWFSNVIKGTYSGYISDVYVSKATGKPCITMAVLIRGQLYKVEAVLAAELDLSYIWELVCPLKVGRTGFIYVADNNGKIIAHPDKTKTGTITDIEEEIKNIKRLDRKSGILEKDLAGSRMIIAYSAVRKYNEFEAPPWIVLVRQPLSEMISPARRAKFKCIIAIFLLIMLSVSVAISLYILKSRVARS